MEQFGPVRVVAGYCPGECQDTVFPVPVRKVVQIIFQRIEYRDAVGVDISADVPIPQGNAFALCVEGNAVQRALVDGGEAETERVAFTVFHLTHLGVVAEVVAAFHELVRLYGKSLLFAEAALGIEAFVLLVNASYNLPDDSLFLA